MSYKEKVEAALPRIKARMKKADSFDILMPATLSVSIQLADGNPDKGRQVASMAAPIAELMQAKDWHPGMATDPGDLVYDPQKQHIYIYTGKTAMVHSNHLFYPGASGVYYWAIVPDMHEGYKVYPGYLTGIIVAVKRDEVWWNTAKTKRYRWNDADNAACVWQPGQQGVHQWVEVFHVVHHV